MPKVKNVLVHIKEVLINSELYFFLFMGVGVGGGYLLDASQSKSYVAASV